MKKLLMVTLAGAVVAASGCTTTEASRSLSVAKVQSSSITPVRGAKIAVSVGKFENRSSFGRGVFSDGVDRLGGQAQTSLVAHLQQSRRFSVLDRTNMAETAQEAMISGKKQQLKGARFVLTGDVTDFGRKVVGDQQLFGILGRGKSQVAYAKVTINVVDASTSEVVYSAGGAGEYSLSSREVVGFGSTSSYDATLNGKVLDLAMRDAVDGLAFAVDSGEWGGSK